MRVEVVVSGWEQACCGELFRIGDRVDWNLFAADPADAPEGRPPRFVEEHHGQIPDDVPHWSVAGTVHAITGVDFPDVPVPGHLHHEWDRARPRHRVLASVGAGHDGECDEYLVELDLPDDAVLPSYVLSAETVAQRGRDAEAGDLALARMRDDVGVLLEALADYAHHRFGDVARIDRSAVSSAVTIEPHRAGAAAVRWARVDADGVDGISVRVGDGSWRFPAAPAHVEVLREFLDAAAAGRVGELVRPRGGPPRRLVTEVSAEDGTTWTATTPYTQVGIGDGAVLVDGSLRQRVQRGDHRYAGWTR